MNETPKGYAPIESIVPREDIKGINEVFYFYKELAKDRCIHITGIFPTDISDAIYRVYLLGVEDGMKGELS